MSQAPEQKTTLVDRLDRGYGRWAVAALLVVAAALFGSKEALAGGAGGMAVRPITPVDVTDTAVGRVLRAQASARLVTFGMTARIGGLRVLRDGDGYLVVPRATPLAIRPTGSPTARRFEVVPVLRPRERRTAAHGTAATAPPAWSFAGGGCYERISDGWSWLDHCARIFRLTQDGDSQRDFYALQRYGTAGANMPWVLKEAELESEPVESSLPMSWQDWNPRSDRSGPCQTITVRVTAPIVGVSQTLDRCETWDITKGATGGDFSLVWSGCACAQDRALAYVLSISVPQGALPAWYVPAEVHGFAF
jgi:hypothetical protein